MWLKKLTTKIQTEQVYTGLSKLVTQTCKVNYNTFLKFFINSSLTIKNVRLQLELEGIGLNFFII